VIRDRSQDGGGTKIFGNRHLKTVIKRPFDSSRANIAKVEKRLGEGEESAEHGEGGDQEEGGS
jgi:hypothetical protein